MITVTRKRITEETFTLIELDLWYQGRYQLMLRIPSRMTESGADSVKMDARRVIKDHFKGVFGREE